MKRIPTVVILCAQTAGKASPGSLGSYKNFPKDIHLSKRGQSAAEQPAAPEGNRLARTEYQPLIFSYQCLLFQCIRAEIFKAA
ncbi:unnamed protein product [Coccothraustes coccothraustes]